MGPFSKHLAHRRPAGGLLGKQGSNFTGVVHGEMGWVGILLFGKHCLQVSSVTFFRPLDI